MKDWLKDWQKIVFFAFLTALFFFVLYILFAPLQAGRYRIIDGTDSMLYMDTATGKVYTIRGKLRSSPHD